MIDKIIIVGVLVTIVGILLWLKISEKTKGGVYVRLKSGRVARIPPELMDEYREYKRFRGPKSVLVDPETGEVVGFQYGGRRED